MPRQRDSDPPQSPGLYGSKHLPIELDRDDEPSQVTRAILAGMAAHDRDYIRKKLASRNTTVPPPKKEHTVSIIIAPIIVSVVLAGAAAGLAMWKNEAISQERQSETHRRISGLDQDLRLHAGGTHAMSIEATARFDAQFNAVLVRLDRIERQLDGQQRRPR